MPLSLSQSHSEAIEALDLLIERLIAFRDLLDGDTDMEDDNQDRCKAEEDPAIDYGGCLPPPLRGAGDPEDGEDGGDAEDEGPTEWQRRTSWLRHRRGKAVQS